MLHSTQQINLHDFFAVKGRHAINQKNSNTYGVIALILIGNAPRMTVP